MGVTKKNRRRITEKNTGGSEGENARRKRESEFPNRIFFANVRYDITEDTLKPFFGAVGPVATGVVARVLWKNEPPRKRAAGGPARR